jgi:glycolate oxidase FAD binding subunit
LNVIETFPINTSPDKSGASLEARDVEDIRDAVLAANSARTKIAVRGAGSKAAIGDPVAADSEIVLTRLAGAIDYEPAELVLTAPAGTRLAEIEALLESNGQMLGFEPMDYGPLFGMAKGRATIGGTIAVNCSGPRRFAGGAARDHFLGFEAVSGRGEIFKGGGKVVKNVTGYDLPKLMAGSWGSLAILTQVTIKVTPKPRNIATLILTGLSDREAAIAMSKAVGSSTAVTGAAHVPATCAAGLSAEALAGLGMSLTLLRVEALSAAIAPHNDALAKSLQPHGIAAVLDEAQSRDLWRSLRDVEVFANDTRPLWRISVAPMQGAAVTQTIAESLAPAQAEWVYDWAGGLVWLTLPAATDAGANLVRAAAAKSHGHATLIRAPASLPDGIPRFEPQPAALSELSRRIKTAFDPAGVLNPGRFFLSGPGL